MKKSKNSSLTTAKTVDNDEFYTRFEDVKEEVENYKDYLKDKVVYCNCDDPAWSEFWKYFHTQFEQLGLKKLISTHYNAQNVSYKMEYTGGNDDDISVGVKTWLQGNGDFRNQECIDLLKESDVIVTNPPFSLFREYVAQLMKYDKKFLIIGNPNAVTYKEIFPLIKENKIWLGVKPWTKQVYFDVPDVRKEFLVKNKKEGSAYVIIDGEVLAKVTSLWFTNLDNKKRHNKLVLKKEYKGNESDYPKFDNYDAINVDKVKEIPKDYDEEMGVPISYLDKYNPEQFELIGHEHDVNGNGGKGVPNGQFEVNKVGKYKRILIKKKEV